MTATQTTILVLIIVAGTVGPWAFIVGSLLKDSSQTYDPLYEPRSYQTTNKTYFLSFDCLFAYFLIGMAVLIIHAGIGAKVTDGSPPWIMYTALGLLALMMSAFAYHILYLNINYWKYTRGTTLSFNPNPKTVTVSTPAREYVIREGDIEHIKMVSNEHPKLLYSYFRIKLKSGDELILTDKMPGIGAIFEYFKEVPFTRHKHDYPLIP